MIYVWGYAHVCFASLVLCVIHTLPEFSNLGLHFSESPIGFLRVLLEIHLVDPLVGRGGHRRRDAKGGRAKSAVSGARRV